jgi:hypothetical protein
MRLLAWSALFAAGASSVGLAVVVAAPRDAQAQAPPPVVPFSFPTRTAVLRDDRLVVVLDADGRHAVEMSAQDTSHRWLLTAQPRVLHRGVTTLRLPLSASIAASLRRRSNPIVEVFATEATSGQVGAWLTYQVAPSPR